MNSRPPPAKAAAATRWWGRHGLDLSPFQVQAFRALYLARLVGVLIYGILGVSIAWQVWSLTQSSLHVAGIGISLASGTVLGLVGGGNLADRADRRRVMIVSRAAYVLVIGLLLANSLRVAPDVSWIYVATFLSGLAGGVSAPSLMSTLPRVLPPNLLSAAGALNALAEQGGRLVGPLIAGALIAAAGVEACLWVVLLGSVLIPVLLSRLPSLPPSRAATMPSPPGFVQSWGEGARFAIRNPVVGGLLGLDVVMAVLATPWVLLPQWGQQVLGGDAQLVGLLHAAPALGAVVAAALSGWTRRLQRPGWVVVGAAIGWGVLVAVLGLGDSLAWTLVVLVLAGGVDTIADIVRVPLLQLHTPDALRGRMSALWLLEANVSPAAGGALMGGLAQRFSPAAALLVGGSACWIVTGGLALGLRGLRACQWTDDRKV